MLQLKKYLCNHLACFVFLLYLFYAHWENWSAEVVIESVYVGEIPDLELPIVWFATMHNNWGYETLDHLQALKTAHLELWGFGMKWCVSA